MSKTKVRSKKGEPFTGDLASGKLMFQTLPFSVAITVPMGDADPDAGADAGPPPVSPMMQAVTLAFTNLPERNIQDSITVTVNGAAYTDFAVAPERQPHRRRRHPGDHLARQRHDRRQRERGRHRRAGRRH